MKKINFIILAYIMLGISISHSQVSSIGSNEYGRIFDLVYDQNIQNRVYAVTMNNHILVSDDNAVSWDILYTLPSGIVKELRIVNGTHLSFYLRSANNVEDDTIYFLELSTLNLSAVNRPINNISNDRWVEDYNIYENNTDIMLYDEGFRLGFDVYERVHYTTDGGQSWTVVYDEDYNNLISIDKVLISYNDPNLLFLTRGNGANGVNGGFLVSNDSGSTWTEYYETLNIRGVAVDPFDSDHWIIGTDPGWGQDEAVYETKNAGVNWSQLNVPFDTYWDKAVNEIIFHPTIQNQIYILETNEIVISYDGGVNWTSYIHDSFDPKNYYFGLSATFNPFDANEILFTSNWYPHRSTDGGVTLQLIQTPYSNVNTVAVSKNEGAQDPFLYYSLQGGLVSKNLTDDSETSYGVLGIDQVSGSAPPMFIVDENQYGRILSSTEDFNGRALNVSNDNGQSFEMFYTGFWDVALHMQLDPVNSNEVWTSFEVFSGSGTKIIDMTSPDPWNPTITEITMPSSGRHLSTWINPSNNQEVLAGIGGEVWSTSDRGTTWNNASNGLTLDVAADKVYQILNNPSNANEFILASSNGVWKSTDGYATWNHILPINNIQKVAYDPNQPDVIVAFVYASPISDTSIYYSTDFGANWTIVSANDLLNIYSTSIDIDFIADGSGFKAYFATSDLGIITYDVLYQSLSLDKPNFKSLAVLMYPNPVKDILNISIANGSQPSSAIIYNMLGAIVKQVDKPTQMDLSGLKTGIYLVKVIDTNGATAVKRIIKL